MSTITSGFIQCASCGHLMRTISDDVRHCDECGRMTALPPVVHLVVLYEAVCHECGWQSDPLSTAAEADTAADQHQCEPSHANGSEA